ncbi:hypothetical protein KJ762_00195 [bacterium]|nr:hypothetical protein [bacterium]MBU1063282.1 hypothetical protein [bacterium]MBU1632915.1 hypothetical protein [bacterium]MBU1873278.1 hypothetical protein [bacterium]
MITTLFLLSVIIGIIIARIQFRTGVHRGSLQISLFRLLMISILFALITGLILHQTNRIDSIRFYLYLISTGTSVGLFMTLERVVKKYWIAVIVTTIAAGLICYLFMNYKTDHITQGSFIVGMAPGIGYLIWGFIKRQRFV